MNLDPITLTVAGVPLVFLNQAITEKTKKIMPKANPELVSIVIGLLIGALFYIQTLGLPGDYQGVIQLVVFMLAQGFAPSGLYELGE